MKRLIIIFVAISLVAIFGFVFFNRSAVQSPQTINQTPTPSPEVSKNQEVNIRASFTIITGTITRSFKAEKYHNQSPDVYIESSNPSIVNVKKAGITWDDFFKTLPMKLSKDCLITGDGETLCNDQGDKLQFFLNDALEPDLLDKEIKQDDKALIKYTFSN